jgi:hypothetical protein
VQGLPAGGDSKFLRNIGTYWPTGVILRRNGVSLGVILKTLTHEILFLFTGNFLSRCSTTLAAGGCTWWGRVDGGLFLLYTVQECFPLLGYSDLVKNEFESVQNETVEISFQ